MKKTISVLLLLCISLCLFSACNKNELPSFDDDTELNFHGGLFTVYTYIYSPLFLEKGASASNDRFNQRLYDIQEEYGIVFKEEYVDTMSMAFITGSLTGTLVADVVIDDPQELYDLYKINTLIPVEEIIENYKDYKFGTDNMAEGATFAGKQYGVFPYVHDTPPSISGLLSLNMDYVNEFNLSDPHEIIEAGEWDWEHFRSFLVESTFSDGNNKYVGLVLAGSRNSSNSFAPFIYSNGGTMVGYSETLGYHVTFDSDAAVEAMEFVASIFSSPYADCPSANETEYILALGVPRFNNPEHEIHALRIPYGPNGSPDTISSIFYTSNYWAFPIFSVYDGEEKSVIVNEIFDPLSDDYPNGWKDYIMDNYFFDTQDYDYYCLATDNAHFIDDDLYGNLFYPALLNIKAGSETVQSLLDTLVSTVQERLDEKYNQ